VVGSILAFVSALAYSCGYILIRTGVRPGDPDGGAFVTTVVNATLLGGAALGAVALGSRPDFAWAGVAWLATSGVLGPFTGRILLFSAIHRVGPVRAAAVINTAPLVTVFLAVTVLGETLTLSDLAATALVVIGLAILVAEAFQAASEDDVLAAPSTIDEAAAAGIALEDRARSMAAIIRRRYGTVMVIGILAASLSAIAFGFARTSRRLGLDEMPDPLLGAAIGALAGLATHLVVHSASGRLGLLVRSSIREPRPRLWAAGALSALGLFTFFAAMTFEPLSHVAVIAASETILTLVLGSLLLRGTERLSARIALPAICVFAGGVLVAVG
jgi:drug/metabolite transporter (DMT)-like permease